MKVNSFIKSDKRKALAVLLMVFCLSVLVRLPNLNRPLSKHHEFCTALTLQILRSWEQEGIIHVNGNPSLNFSNSNDKFINNYGSLSDDKGNYYYLSHPPLAYYLPYAVFQVLGVKADVLPLQIFNLIIHLLSALLIFSLMGRLIPPDKQAWWSALLLASIYLMMPSVLWFQGNVYMSDILVFMFYLLTIYFYLRLRTEGGARFLFFHSISVFLMVYTSWLGVFYTLSIIIFSLLDRDRFKRSHAFWTSVATFIAVMLMVIQYAQIQGFSAYFESMTNRFSERSGFSSSGENSFLLDKCYEFFRIVKNMLSSYLPHLLLVFFVLLFRKRLRPIFNDDWKKIMLLASLPIFLLHLLLMNYAGHDFVQLPWSLVLLLMLVPVAKFSGRTIGISVAILLSSIFLYYYVNRPGDISLNGDSYAMHQDLANEIRQNSSVDEVLFISGQYPEPQLIYYTGRNICFVDEKKDIERQMKLYTSKKGVLIQLNKTKYQIKRVKHFGMNKENLAHELILTE